MGEITVNKSNRPKGAMIGVPGLGAFENGQKHQVDDARLNRYRKRRNIQGDVVFGKPLSGSPSSPPSAPSSPGVGGRTEPSNSEEEDS